MLCRGTWSPVVESDESLESTAGTVNQESRVAGYGTEPRKTRSRHKCAPQVKTAPLAPRVGKDTGKRWQSNQQVDSSEGKRNLRAMSSVLGFMCFPLFGKEERSTAEKPPGHGAVSPTARVTRTRKAEDTFSSLHAAP